jgi:hypothetical protein
MLLSLVRSCFIGVAATSKAYLAGVVVTHEATLKIQMENTSLIAEL